MNELIRAIKRLPRKGVIASTAMAMLVSISSSWANTPIYPLTKVKITILQWKPTKGSYETLAGVGGDYVVSESSMLVLPVAGAISIQNMDGETLAAEIAARVQKKIGLVDPPDTTVEIVEYAPIYVLGEVQKPGEQKFRLGMTVLQAVAVGGGPLRLLPQDADQERAADTVRMLSEDMVRAKARIARLEAERDRATEISRADTTVGDEGLSAQVYAQETFLLQARRNELERQTKSLDELLSLLDAEIGNLEQKMEDVEASIVSTQRELKGVTTLVQKGIVVSSRQGELERLLANGRADKLDIITAIMRARQQKTEAKRNLEGLQDARQTSIATDLQDQQGKLNKLTVQLAAAQRDLLESVDGSDANMQSRASFTITRNIDGTQVETAATASTRLSPGDVVTVDVEGVVDTRSLTQSTTAQDTLTDDGTMR